MNAYIKLLEDQIGDRATRDIDRTQPRPDDGSIMEPILDLCQAMGAIVFTSDIEDIVMLGKVDLKTNHPRPPPVKVTFEQFHMRDKIMQRKSGLMHKEKYAKIFINADEPADIRRMKGFLRRVAYKARNLGKDVQFHSDWIQIDGVTYKSTELEKIPREYNPDNTRPKNPD